MKRTVLIPLVIGCASPAYADDLSDALGYVRDNFGANGVTGYEAMTENDKHEGLAFINSRDVTENAELESYDCRQSPVDGEAVVRLTPEQRWADRACHEYKWRQKSLPGFRTLGTEQLTERDIQPWAEMAEARYNVPAVIIINIIRYKSGFRPGVVSEKGHIGLMQLNPRHLRSMGIQQTTGLENPQTNIMVGTDYFARLIVRTGGYMSALSAYADGPLSLLKGGWNGADREVLWFVREVDRMYFVHGRAFRFPNDVGVESMKFIWNWLE